MAEEPEPVPLLAVGSGPVTQLALFEHFRRVKDRNRVRRALRPQASNPPTQQSLFLKLEKEATHERKSVIRSESAR